MTEELRKLHTEFEPEALDDKIDMEVRKLDAIVGEALGLLKEDIADVQSEMADDPFLSKVRPRSLLAPAPIRAPHQFGAGASLRNRIVAVRRVSGQLRHSSILPPEAIARLAIWGAAAWLAAVR
jgi:hypothetical protein